ncbi:MAG TPA: type II toxin-antitoxin system VapC family toxin [Gammaproteobacteria bacterium]|nr:type II toxin-antitoxin system VapC family toxin [Gammaproteobacteria bacterium]
MAVLVDTCGWIEWLTDGPLADRFEPYLKGGDDLLVPTCVQFELYKWVRRERNESLALEAIALTEEATVVPLSTASALLAADLALEHRLSFADALVYATARQQAVALVTSDDHFADLPGVTYFDKRDL